MAKAKKHPGGSWRVQASVTLNGQMFKRSFTATTARKAEAEANEWQDHIKMIGSDSTRMTVSEAIRQYIDSNEGDLSPSTVREYERILKNDMQDLMDKKLFQLTCPIIKNSMNKASENLSPKTVKNRYSLLKTVLSVYYPDFVWAVKYPKQRKKKKRAYSHLYISQILNAIRSTDFELEVYLGMLSMRESEIGGLMFLDVNFEERYLDISRAKLLNKNNEYVIVDFNKTEDSTRRVYLPTYVVYLLKERQKISHGEYVSTVNPNQYWKRLNKIMQNNNVEKLKFHELRHIYSSLTSALGIDQQIRMENGGWSNAAIMDGTYRHGMSEAQESANKKMEEYFSNATTKANPPS